MGKNSEMVKRFNMIKAMNLLVCQMNDEEAYFRWIYVVPDEANDDDLMDVAEDDDLFNESCQLFNELVKDYGCSGYYVDNKVFGGEDDD